MGITYTEIIGSRSASVTEDGVSFTKVYDVRTTDSDKTATTVQVLAAGPYSIGDEVESYPVTALDLTEDPESPDSWIYTVQYSADVEDISQDSNPLLQAPTYSVSYQQYEEPIDQDINGKPIINSAGDIFEDVVTRDQSRPVINVSYNSAGFNFGFFEQFVDTVNRGAFLGLPDKTVKLNRVAGTQTTTTINDQELTYWEISLEFVHSKNGWKREILDSGYREIDDDAEDDEIKLKPIIIDGKPATAPVLLRDGTSIQDPTTEPPSYIEFEVYNSSNFAGLGI